MNQLVIAATGLMALGLLMGDNRFCKRLAPWIGLVGQPFWLWETWHATQAGMFLLSCGYTLIYLFGCWDSVRSLKRRAAVLPPGVNPPAPAQKPPPPFTLIRPGARRLQRATTESITMIELGKKYRDTVTGFEGTCTATGQFLHGIDRAGLEAGLDKDGKPQELRWFDAPRLEAVAEAA